MFGHIYEMHHRSPADTGGITTAKPGNQDLDRLYQYFFNASVELNIFTKETRSGVCTPADPMQWPNTQPLKVERSAAKPSVSVHRDEDMGHAKTSLATIPQWPKAVLRYIFKENCVDVLNKMDPEAAVGRMQGMLRFLPPVSSGKHVFVSHCTKDEGMQLFKTVGVP